MGLFSLFSQDIAMDLGTANIIIIHNDKIVIDEPSVIAIDAKTGKLIATGEQARRMQGRTHENIKTIRPLKDGVIADFNAAEMMIKNMIKRTVSQGLFAPSLKIVICIPSGSTDVEMRAVRDSAEHAGGRDIYTIYEPMAAALGIGIDVEAPGGNMVVDIGGGTSEIAVISLGGIVCCESINIAGDVFTEDIQSYIRQQYNIRVGEQTAENIKIHVGAAIDELDSPPEDFHFVGHNILDSKPNEIAISYKEVAYALDKSLVKLDNAIIKVLERTPPELYSDIVRNGIYVTGGGALLRGLDKRLSQKTNLNFVIADDPLRSVAKGTGLALKNIGKFSFLRK